ncbi:MAG: PAS domain S-box protein [Deltaproteobacteria bacterium]|nr:PAS domain S-box protein [Deltaproteobacteria bacterium]
MADDRLNDRTELRMEALAQQINALQDEYRELQRTAAASKDAGTVTDPLFTEHWFRMVRHSPMGMHMYKLYPEANGPGRLVFAGANPAADRLLGLDNSLFVGKTIEDAFPPLRDTEVPERYRSAARGGIPWSTEQINYEGERIAGAFEVHAFQIAPNEMVATFLNITERKQTEMHLRDNQRRLSQLTEILDRSMDMISSSTPEQVLIYLNPAGKRLLGWGDDTDVPALHIEDVHPAWALNIIQNEGIPAAIENGLWQGETALHTVNGGIIPVFQTIFSHSDPESGALSFLSTIIRDISENRRNEQEIRRLQDFLANILDSMASLIVAVDNDGHITHWNNEAQKQTGYTSADVLGKPLKEFAPIIGKFDHLIRDAIQSGEPQSLLRQKGVARGEPIFVDIVVFPLTSSGAVVRMDNVTDRAQMEEMLIQSEKMQSIGELAAGMAHEINNPLAGILQNLQVLRGRIDPALPGNWEAAERLGISLEQLAIYLKERKVDQMLDHIHDAAMRASEIVRNMLSFSRRSSAVENSQDIVALVKKTVALVQSDYDLSTNYDFRKIHMDQQVSESVPPVICEPAKIQQVLLNLITNAIYAMNAKTYTLDAAPELNIAIRPIRGGDWVEIAITDNGLGMTEDTARRIFEPFFTTKPVGEGTGLGLAVAYYIVVQQHHGHMSVESTPDMGTTFRVQLPVRR